MKTPFSGPPPRVPRSRRDDRFEPGYPPPPKRAAAGYVVSIQDEYDTVTVDVLDEQLTGVIPLAEMPPVGAIVEVESRGDLLVIPMWFPGPEPGCTPRIIRANGTLYPNTGAVTGPADVVGSVPLGDDDDATWIDCHNGSITTCIGLPACPDIPIDSPITLHTRIEVFADLAFGGHGEMFLATTHTISNTEIGGFSDGTTSGYGFHIGTEAIGGPHDYVVPLNMTPWGPTHTLAEVIAGLEAGTLFLDINAFGWATGSTPPLFRIYEAYIEIGCP